MISSKKKAPKKVVSFNMNARRLVEANATTINEPRTFQDFDDMEYYKYLLKRYGDDLKQVFLGFDANINPLTLKKDIKKATSNRHFALIKNLRYIIRSDMYDHHNTDLDDYDTPQDNMG